MTNTTFMIASAVPATCPDCGSVVTIDRDAETERTILRQSPGTMPYVERVRVSVTVAFCSGCEWAREVVTS